MSHVTSVPVALPVVAGRTPARIPNRHGVSDIPLGGWGAIVFGAPFVILWGIAVLHAVLAVNSAKQDARAREVADAMRGRR